jgi:hypothetical protein
VRVKDERAQGGVLVSAGRREPSYHLVQHRFHIPALLGGDVQDVIQIHAEQRRQVQRHVDGAGHLEVYLVDDGDDLEVGLKGQVEVGQRLGLNALSGVHDEDGTLAGSQRSAHLV